MMANDAFMELDGICYRAAKLDDYFQVKEMVLELFDMKLSMDNYKDYITKKEVDVIVAEDLHYHSANDIKNPMDSKLMEKYLCGLLCIERQWIAFANYINFYLRNGGVRNRYRRKGIFGNLIKIAEQRARSEKVYAIELTCAASRIEAHRFYLNHGFTIKKTNVFINELVD